MLASYNAICLQAVTFLKQIWGLTSQPSNKKIHASFLLLT